jgi:hypothetical protein
MKGFWESRTLANFAAGEFASSEARRFPKRVLVGYGGKIPADKPQFARQIYSDIFTSLRNCAIMKPL